MGQLVIVTKHVTRARVGRINDRTWCRVPPATYWRRCKKAETATDASSLYRGGKPDLSADLEMKKSIERSRDATLQLQRRCDDINAQELKGVPEGARDLKDETQRREVQDEKGRAEGQVLFVRLRTRNETGEL
ncbi:hypothetical protein TRVL_07547 [Trypanosoma vivax]|nr:hypothetical protein TRVL_07547 [Trypanosoma vivax]